MTKQERNELDNLHNLYLENNLTRAEYYRMLELESLNKNKK